ncbi:hypothetical protein [Nocardia exalbida]|uniref:hypothetical protein n=1 Tax=Nocardia exalbida TaxID=290231 RepID=UPI0012F67BE5|nr:hypothetical protein [Nocardia exalbida]
MQLTLHRRRLDHLVVDICESPGIIFDVGMQAGAVADRFERHQSMQPGDTVPLWVKAARGHGRRLRLRVTAGLEDKLWDPVLLPDFQISIDGSDEP